MIEDKKIIINNKKSSFNYELVETFKAGLMLEGWMVKSMRAGKVSASDSVYIRIVKGEAFLVGLHITAMKTTSNVASIDEQPVIKLLLNRKEINKLISGQSEKGYTIVLKDVFWEKQLVKATICLGRGKKLHDKRQSLKDKQNNRESD